MVVYLSRSCLDRMANCTVDMGLKQEDTTAIRDAWMAVIDATNTAVLQAGGLTWPMFTGRAVCLKDRL